VQERNRAAKVRPGTGFARHLLALAREIGGEFLKGAERPRCLIGLLVTLDFIIAFRVLDERIGPPQIALGVEGIGLAIPRWDAC